jgi:signal transduction histidine kinase
MKILVVDDLPENRYLMEQLLQGNGHEVTGAVDGLDALDKLSASNFDLIVADIMMPRMDGFELCHNVKLNPELSPIPFIFYTASYTTEEDRVFALSLGANAFILKPEEPQVFIQNLKEVLANPEKTPPAPAQFKLRHDQVEFLKSYNQRLHKKVAQKFEQLRSANRKLNELNRDLEERVREKTSQLERSTRELESFAYTVSHDLRAPLRAIAGYSDILNESAAAKLSPEEQSFLEKITSVTRYMDRMIGDVLDYSSIGATVACERVDVAAVVRDVIQSDPGFGGRIEVVNSLHCMIAHEPSLRQAIFNLLGNAIKFVPPGIEPRVRIGSDSRGEEVRLWIEDNGIGIPTEKQQKLFRIFERLHPQYEGSGIGLAIVARAVERMHGKLGVESDPGKGSRFWLQLPRAE